MKYKILIFTVILALMACGNNSRSKLPTTGNFGIKVITDSLKTVGDVINLLQTKTETNVNVTGIIEKVCKGEGCWLTLENKVGDALFIEIENKAFILPKGIEGKVAIINGKAIKEQKNGKTEIIVLAKAINIE
jgi:hypothetical protein